MVEKFWPQDVQRVESVYQHRSQICGLFLCCQAYEEMVQWIIFELGINQMKQFISLKNSLEFGNVYKRGKSYANKYLVMYIVDNNLESNRLGISVSKKVGNSVVRHRITRLIREVYRLQQHNLIKGKDIVVVARVNSKGRNYWDMESAFLHLAKLHRILDSSEECTK